MKFASWNVNSLRVRLPQVLEWLNATQVDVLGIQETKTQDIDFPLEAIRNAGYDACFSGQKTYNGVATLVRQELTANLGTMDDVVTDLVGLDDPQRRVLITSLGDNLRVANVYIPNGSSVDSDKYTYKLEWLACLKEQLRRELEQHPRLILMGDFNIAPADEDVHDPAAWEGNVIVSAAEREAFRELEGLGLVDSFRCFEQKPNLFSWWDYRAAGFRRNRGVRIDLIMCSKALSQTLVSSSIDRGPRGWERPSDHAPIVAEFTL